MNERPSFPRILLPLGAAAVLLVAAALVLKSPAPIPVALPDPLVETPPPPDPPAPPGPIAADPPAPPPAPQEKPTIEVAFVLDTTGSMGGMLDGAKRKIVGIASRLAQGRPTPHLRVGLVAYRDRGDTYVTRTFNLSDDLDAVSGHLQSFRAEGGGDWAEHVGRGLADAVNRMSWTQEGQVLRMVFVVGDAPPHAYGDGFDADRWARTARARGITVSTLRCGPAQDTAAAFAHLAELGGGTFHSVDEDGGMREEPTPYDGDLASVNKAIAGTALYAGDEEVRAKAESKKAAVAALPAAVAADRLSFFAARSEPAAPTMEGARDVVASGMGGLGTGSLPAELQALPPAEREARVQALAKERSKLEKTAGELASKRSRWLSEHADKDAGSLDGRVMDDLKTKAKGIGVLY